MSKKKLIIGLALSPLILWVLFATSLFVDMLIFDVDWARGYQLYSEAKQIQAEKRALKERSPSSLDSAKQSSLSR